MNDSWKEGGRRNRGGGREEGEYIGRETKAKEWVKMRTGENGTSASGRVGISGITAGGSTRR